jgi:mannose-6-phosphate isomerase-like protein (cupin superfamily)
MMDQGGLVMPRFDLETTGGAPGEALDGLGPRIRFLTALSDNDADYCLVAGAVPAGVVVPVHSHPERETFCILEGELQALRDSRWITLGAGGRVRRAGRSQARLAKPIRRLRLAAVR